MRRLVLASAGAGKSRLVVGEAIEKSKAGSSVLLLTYTENNQKELLNKICLENGYKNANITIKGWFTFLLEDMIRPYQRCIFPERIEGVNFNSKNPHKTNNGKNIPGTAERINGEYNPVHYLKRGSNKVHTINIAKLASRVIKETKRKPILRLLKIFDAIYIDEVQDLVGYDFEIIKAITKSTCGDLVCVGDFRQTVYATSIASKSPKNNAEKFKAFKDVGFQDEHLSISWRCVQPICDFPDLVHAEEEHYLPTSSKVNEIPDKFSDHVGVFAVHSNDLSAYISKFNPVILRLNRSTQIELCKDRSSFNFGEAKGLGFDRVLVISTEKQRNFISGDFTVFNNDKTEKARNTFYVAITRARYSIAFVYDGMETCNQVEKWIND